MLGLLGRLRRLGGPAGVVAVAVGVGLGAGLLATHAVLAAWTYRDAARRDLRRPGRWAGGVLAFGLVAFVPYLVLRRSGDDREHADGALAGKGAPEPVDGAASGDDAAAVESRPRTVGPTGRSVAGIAARGLRFGGRLLGRGARWAGERAFRELAD